MNAARVVPMVLALAVAGCPALIDDEFRVDPAASSDIGGSNEDGGGVTGEADGGPTTTFAPGAASPSEECPAACTAGCNGGTCAIEASSAAVVCPAGWPCRVRCSGSGCSGTITCAENFPCTVECVGEKACDGTRFAASNATSLCLRCDGKGACKSLACEAPSSCSASCASTSSCAALGSCSACTSVDACP